MSTNDKVWYYCNDMSATITTTSTTTTTTTTSLVKYLCCFCVPCQRVVLFPCRKTLPIIVNLSLLLSIRQGAKEFFIHVRFRWAFRKKSFLFYMWKCFTIFLLSIYLSPIALFLISSIFSVRRFLLNSI